MAKLKMSKKAASIDMTAMCDVAFLLLTFFILTATAKHPEPLPVQTPASTVLTKLPETGLVTITVGRSNVGQSVFFGMKDRDVRAQTLELMGEKYGVKFTPDEVAQFSLIEDFGVPVSGRILNGLWLDFLVVVIMHIYLNNFSLWIINKPYKIIISEKTK
jgi:biopolymer transport protein ExbD